VAPATRKPVAAKAAAAAAPANLASEKLLAGRAAGQSRLKLDPLEVLSERVATLESSSATAPAEQAAREARDAQRLQSLESSVKSLLAVATRNEANLAELRLRLQQSESDRYANPLVYALAGLLLVCLAGIAFLLTRRGGGSTNGGNWWSGSANTQNTVRAADVPAQTVRSSGFSPMSSPAPLTSPGALQGVDPSQPRTARVGLQSKPAPITQVDVSLVEMSESTFDRLMQSGTTHSAVRKSRPEEPVEQAHDTEPPHRLINSDELFDIRQQAEFFVSLGQTDQAVRILENRISESGESSPQAYLDLLKIFHSLGLKADFRQVREDFNLLFNARVPEFASFDSEGRDLEAYPEIVAGLVQVWGKPEILPNIEALLFRDQWASQRELLDLAAFRDLLLLHGVAYGASTLPDRLLLATGRTLPRNPYANPGRQVVQTPASQVAALDDIPTGLPSTALDLPPLVGLSGGEIDIDLSDLSFDLSLSQSLDTAPAQAQISALDPGNLIDFGMPELLPGGSESKKSQ
jgi:hypothetical protein